MIKLSKVSESAIFPTRGSEGAAGYDLYSTHNLTLMPMARAKIETGIACELSPDVVGIVKPRSGLAVRYGIEVLGIERDDKTLAGVIDSDFRDSMKVVLINLGSEPLVISEGDRIAQILFMPVIHDVVEHDGRVSETARGLGGFGSTGN